MSHGPVPTGLPLNIFPSWSQQALRQCITLKVVERLLYFWEICSKEFFCRGLPPSTLPCVCRYWGLAACVCRVGAGEHFPLALPGAGLAACPPLYSQVPSGWNPVALRTALPGPGCASCGLGPPCLLPCPQVRALCLQTCVWEKTHIGAGVCVGVLIVAS